MLCSAEPCSYEITEQTGDETMSKVSACANTGFLCRHITYHSIIYTYVI
jgi:hypothetical protein